MLSVVMLSVVFNLRLSSVSLCWVSLFRMSLCWVSLCWLSWRRGLHYEWVVIVNYASTSVALNLAKSVKVSCKLKRTFSIVNYDCNTFILQTTALLYLYSLSVFKFEFVQSWSKFRFGFKIWNLRWRSRGQYYKKFYVCVCVCVTREY